MPFPQSRLVFKKLLCGFINTIYHLLLALVDYHSLLCDFYDWVWNHLSDQKVQQSFCLDVATARLDSNMGVIMAKVQVEVQHATGCLVLPRAFYKCEQALIDKRSLVLELVVREQAKVFNYLADVEQQSRRVEPASVRVESVDL